MAVREALIYGAAVVGSATGLEADQMYLAPPVEVADQPGWDDLLDGEGPINITVIGTKSFSEPGVRWEGAEPDPEEMRAVERELIAKGLLDEEAVRAWGLCPAEIKALQIENDVQDWVSAVYPEEPDWDRRNREARHQYRLILVGALIVAEYVGSPCVADEPDQLANYATVTGEVDGVQYTARIPDGDVMGPTRTADFLAVEEEYGANRVSVADQFATNASHDDILGPKGRALLVIRPILGRLLLREAKVYDEALATNS